MRLAIGVRAVHETTTTIPGAVTRPYSIVGRPQGRRGATKAELLAAIFGPAGAAVPYPAADEVFNKLTGDEGLGALEVTTPTNAPARWHLSIKQTLRMYFTAAMALVPPEARGSWCGTRRNGWLCCVGCWQDLTQA
jgi:hypothetical protein